MWHKWETCFPEYFFAESRAMKNIRREQDIPTRLSSQNYLHPLPPYSKYLLKKQKRKIVQAGGPNLNPEKKESSKPIKVGDLRKTVIRDPYPVSKKSWLIKASKTSHQKKFVTSCPWLVNLSAQPLPS